MRFQPDRARPSGRVLSSDDGVWQSYVDLDDPTYLHLPYVQWLAEAIDTVAPRPRARHGVHVGGGGLTLPRWLAATRPGSTSTVFEIDADVVSAVAGLLESPGTAVRVADGRDGLAEEPSGVADLVVTDAFDGRRVPACLLGSGCVAEVVRVLRPGGLYLLNVIDDPPHAQLAGALATVRARFAHVGFVTIASVLAGRAGGNAVVVASDAPVDFPGLARRCAPHRAVVAGQDETAHWCEGAEVLP